MAETATTTLKLDAEVKARLKKLAEDGVITHEVMEERRNRNRAAKDAELAGDDSGSEPRL